jgi:hypothetical protein
MTLSEDARDVADRLITSLPPAFVALLAINGVFILGLLWFMHDLAITRIEAVTKIFEVCTRTLGKG